MPVRFPVLTLLLVVAGHSPARGQEAKLPEKSRSFTFVYAATVTGLPPGTRARVWLPVPATNDEQQVRERARALPADAATAVEPKFGNTILYFEAAARADGTVPMRIEYGVTRREAGAEAAPAARDREDDAVFLRADRRVPIDGKPLTLLHGKTLPRDSVALARVLYDTVNAHLKYGKDKPGWGNGDSNWACDNRSGNCSDFHSLFISLARANHLPAKFEIGFAIPEARGEGSVAGYHCWAWFRPADRGWTPVDISEANRHPKLEEYYFGHLTADRVAFAVGRDLTLAPKQAGPPVNFLIYPYVEVEGKPLPARQVAGHFAYRDDKD